MERECNAYAKFPIVAADLFNLQVVHFERVATFFGDGPQFAFRKRDSQISTPEPT
ncbi:MAG: hypothetical protein V4726_03015 [Verrucomicrobiota bacterium]